MIELNQGQKEAAEFFYSFLMGDQKEMTISGSGGVGKTFLMGYLIDNIIPKYHDMCQILGIPPKYSEVHMTATTNKAAQVLGISTNRHTSTIQSLLNLIVKENFTTGETELKPSKNWKVHHNMVVFIDEASMVSRELRKYINEGFSNCKIIYVGDHKQLADIRGTKPHIFYEGLPGVVLTEPMRNKGQPHLQEVCNAIGRSVETGIFTDIPVLDGVLDYLSPDEMMVELPQHFLTYTGDRRIICYDNNKVNSLNSFIRSMRGITEPYVEGEMMVSNSAIQLRKGMISVEETVVIDKLDTVETVTFPNGGAMQVQWAAVTTQFEGTHYLPLPMDKAHHIALQKYYAKLKDWVTYFNLKNNYPDLRPMDASTVHKAQGSTYDTIYIDLDSISQCRNPEVAARLMYVAFTRASNRVVTYGSLAEKYGRIIQ